MSKSKYELNSAERRWHRNHRPPVREPSSPGPLDYLTLDEQTEQFFAPPIGRQVREILREQAGRPWPSSVEGEPIGAYPGPQPTVPVPPPVVLNALKYLAIVHHWNNAIKHLRNYRLGVAQWMNYLVLWKEHEKTINAWRKKHGPV
jgi:hypothetical protein